MAAPSFVAASTGSTDSTGPWTHTSVAPGAAGRLLVVHAISDGTNSLLSITSVTNAENLAGTDGVLTQLFPDGSHLGTSLSPAGKQWIWFGRSLSTSAMVITGANSAGDDIYVRVYEFDNVSTGTTLATIIENGTAGAFASAGDTSATALDTGVTTLGIDRLALNFVGVNDDNAISAFTGEAGGDWTLATTPYADSGGTDGAIALMTSVLIADLGCDGNADFSWGTVSGGIAKVAQSFLTGSATALKGIQLRLQKWNTPADNLTISIQADSGGNPSGTPLVSTTVLSSDLPSADTYMRFVTLDTTLSASTTYWIVIERTGALDDTNYYLLGTPGGDNYADGTAKYYISSWTTLGYDLAFGVLFDEIGATVNGGTGSIVDSDAWGVIGFALIGTSTYTPPAAGDLDVFIRHRRHLQAVKRASYY